MLLYQHFEAIIYVWMHPTDHVKKNVMHQSNGGTIMYNGTKLVTLIRVGSFIALMELKRGSMHTFYSYTRHKEYMWSALLFQASLYS